MEKKDRWEKRKRKTEEPVGKERHIPVRDVFDMLLTEVGRLALVRDCFSCTCGQRCDVQWDKQL